MAWSSTDNLSVDDQQKAILYNNAIDFATANNVQLGTALTDQQIASLDKPMLWYTEQTVPDPSCSFSSTTCGTIKALVPEVYLPANYAANTAGGVISGSDVTLNFSDSITNTGIIQATNLAVQTNTLTNEQRSVDIGTSDYKVQGGWVEYTGTQLQPGGFMSAVNMDIQAQRITAVNNAFQVLNSDGTVDAAGTTALLTSLRQQLGGDFTETTASDNIKTNFIKDTSGPGAFAAVIAIAVAIAISIVTAGAGLALVGAVTGSTVAAGSVAAAVAAGLQAAIVGTLSSAITQVVTTGSLNVGDALKSGAVSGLTAGITQGVLGDTGMSTSATGVVQSNPSTALSNLASTAVKVGEQSLISAAVKTTIEGGSFGTAFRNSVVSGAAAVGANAIGQADANDAFGTGVSGEAIYLAAHAVLGCAASAAEGTGCAGGAIGGAVSAGLSPLVRDSLYGGTETVTTATNADGSVTQTTSYDNANYNAVTEAIAALAGGTAAGLLGQNIAAGATWADNEAVNNADTAKMKNIFSLQSICGTRVCSDETIKLLNSTESTVTQGALNSMKTMAPYAAATAGVVLLGPEAITGAVLAGTFDYAGDTLSNMMGLSTDQPSFAKSYTAGLVGGAMTPLAIGDKAVAGYTGIQKYLAITYNAGVAGAAAGEAAVLTNQDSGGAAATATIATALGNTVKTVLPGAFGNALNQMIQGAAGPVQSAIQNVLGK